VKERTHAIAYVTDTSTPEEYGAIVREQIKTLQKLVVDAGLKPK
jgi:hypothetical protein